MYVFTRTKHITEQALRSLVRKELPESELGQVREHLSSCGYCRTQLREIQQLISVLGLPREEDQGYMLVTA